jgi:hypothetical protein
MKADWTDVSAIFRKLGPVLGLIDCNIDCNQNCEQRKQASKQARHT